MHSGPGGAASRAAASRRGGLGGLTGNRVWLLLAIAMVAGYSLTVLMADTSSLEVDGDSPAECCPCGAGASSLRAGDAKATLQPAPIQPCPDCPTCDLPAAQVVPSSCGDCEECPECVCEQCTVCEACDEGPECVCEQCTVCEEREECEKCTASKGCPSVQDTLASSACECAPTGSAAALTQPTPENDRLEWPGTVGARIAGFYHIALTDKERWEPAWEEQIATLEGSGLLDRSESFTVHATGSNGEMPPLHPRMRVVRTGDAEMGRHEEPALTLLHDYCRENPDHYVYYLHSKGANVKRDAIKSGYWRRFMMYFVVERWMDCLAQLVVHGFDTCGAAAIPGYDTADGELHFTLGDLPHYSGNFWWASCSHVSRLPSPCEWSNPDGYPKRMAPGTHPCRVDYEMWIGNADVLDRRKMANCFQKDMNYYLKNVHRRKYAGNSLCRGNAPAQQLPPLSRKFDSLTDWQSAVESGEVRPETGNKCVWKSDAPIVTSGCWEAPPESTYLTWVDHS